MQEHHLTVARTARYYTLGNADAPSQLWFVLHGYGQLAGRFLRHFAPIDDGTRLIVAPEALSRYYLEVGAHGPESRVGATWMTREDRLSEINDYVAYLDTLHEHLLRSVAGGVADVRVIGFSQGAATASRWVAMGRARIDRLYLWGGALPPDLDVAAAKDLLERARLTIVVGRGDRHATPEQRATLVARLADAGLPLRLAEFDGGHHIDPATLLRLASE